MTLVNQSLRCSVIEDWVAWTCGHFLAFHQQDWSLQQNPSKREWMAGMKNFCLQLPSTFQTSGRFVSHRGMSSLKRNLSLCVFCSSSEICTTSWLLFYSPPLTPCRCLHGRTPTTDSTGRLTGYSREVFSPSYLSPELNCSPFPAPVNAHVQCPTNR